MGRAPVESKRRGAHLRLAYFALLLLACSSHELAPVVFSPDPELASDARAWAMRWSAATGIPTAVAHALHCSHMQAESDN